MDKNKEQEIKDFQNFIIAEAKSKGKDPNAYAKELGEEGMKEAYKRFQAKKQKKAQKAAHGTKLQYFRTLKNQCPEGEELYYYKKGGSVGCGCKKKEDGGEVVKAGVGVTLAVQAFKNRKKKQEEKKNTWGNTSKIVGKDYQRGQKDAGPKSKVQDSAVPNEDIPSHDKLKTKGIKMKNDHMKCGGTVSKFKAKKHQQGGKQTYFRTTPSNQNPYEEKVLWRTKPDQFGRIQYFLRTVTPQPNNTFNNDTIYQNGFYNPSYRKGVINWQPSNGSAFKQLELKSGRK